MNEFSKTQKKSHKLSFKGTPEDKDLLEFLEVTKRLQNLRNGETEAYIELTKVKRLLERKLKKYAEKGSKPDLNGSSELSDE